MNQRNTKSGSALAIVFTCLIIGLAVNWFYEFAPVVGV